MSEYSFELPLDLSNRAREVLVRTREGRVDGMVYLHPQDVFNLLPDDIQNDIDLAHFKATLHASHALFAERQHQQIEKHAIRHTIAIEQVEKP